MNWRTLRKLIRMLGRRRVIFVIFIISLGVSTLIYWKFFHNEQIDFYDRKKMTVRHVLWWNSMPRNYKSKRFCEFNYCEFSNDRKKLSNSKAILFYGSSMKIDDFPLPRQAHQHWALLHEESPRNVPFLSNNKILEHFNTTSTFSRFSDFPLTTQHLPNAHMLISQNYFVPSIMKQQSRNAGQAPVAFIQSDCDTPTRREDYIRELMRHIRIDSFGSCLHNRDLPKR